MIETVYCGNCGGATPPMKFCVHCGTRLNQPGEAAQPSQGQKVSVWCQRVSARMMLDRKVPGDEFRCPCGREHTVLTCAECEQLVGIEKGATAFPASAEHFRCSKCISAERQTSGCEARASAIQITPHKSDKHGTRGLPAMRRDAVRWPEKDEYQSDFWSVCGCWASSARGMRDLRSHVEAP